MLEAGGEARFPLGAAPSARDSQALPPAPLPASALHLRTPPAVPVVREKPLRGAGGLLGAPPLPH